MDQTNTAMRMETEVKLLTVKMDDIRKRIHGLKNTLLASEGTEKEALKMVANIRESCIEETNTHFDEIVSRITTYSQEYINKIEREIFKLELYRNHIESKLKEMDSIQNDTDCENYKMNAEKAVKEAKKCLLCVEGPTLEIIPLHIEVEKEEFSMVPPKVHLTLGEWQDNKNELQKETVLKPLREIATKTWELQFTRDLPVTCHRIKLIHDKIYCCLDEGITIFDLDLLPFAAIHAGKMESIRDVVPYSYSNLIVASNKGLFHVTSAGAILSCINEDDYTSVTLDGILIFGSTRESTIKVFDSSKSWAYLYAFSLECISDCHWITLGMWRHNIVSCCMSDQRVRISHANGVQYCVLGSGQLNKPYVCQVDKEGTILVAEYNNHRLQTVDVKGQWSIMNGVGLQLQSAISEGNNLFTLNHPNKKIEAYRYTDKNSD